MCRLSRTASEIARLDVLGRVKRRHHKIAMGPVYLNERLTRMCRKLSAPRLSCRAVLAGSALRLSPDLFRGATGPGRLGVRARLVEPSRACAPGGGRDRRTNLWILPAGHVGHVYGCPTFRPQSQQKDDADSADHPLEAIRHVANRRSTRPSNQSAGASADRERAIILGYFVRRLLGVGSADSALCLPCCRIT
jgi:hypothetical protein